jgi:hypothetical protein
LRGDDLEAAKAWMATRKVGAPEITDAQRALISASEEAEEKRFLATFHLRGFNKQIFGADEQVFGRGQSD